MARGSAKRAIAGVVIISAVSTGWSNLTIRGIPNADQAEGCDRMFVMPGYENADLSIPHDYHECLGTTFLSAIEAARSSRFEHTSRHG